MNENAKTSVDYFEALRKALQKIITRPKYLFLLGVLMKSSNLSALTWCNFCACCLWIKKGKLISKKIKAVFTMCYVIFRPKATYILQVVSSDHRNLWLRLLFSKTSRYYCCWASILFKLISCALTSLIRNWFLYIKPGVGQVRVVFWGPTSDRDTSMICSLPILLDGEIMF